MALGDIYQLRVEGNYQGENFMNVYYYEQTVGSGDSNDLDLAWRTDVNPQVAAVQHVDALTTIITTINYNDPTDFNIQFLSSSGVRTGDPMPSYAAWSFLLSRASRDIRNGGKRICGISEEDTLGNQPDASIVTALGNLATSLAATITAAGSEWKPVIVRLAGVPAVPVLVVDVAGAQFRKLSTQNSRKIRLTS